MSVEFDITDKADLEMARWDIRRHVRFALGVTSRAALDLAAEFPRGSRAADVNARLTLIDRLIDQQIERLDRAAGEVKP
jgi:hypothetical protein